MCTRGAAALRGGGAAPPAAMGEHLAGWPWLLALGCCLSTLAAARITNQEIGECHYKSWPSARQRGAHPLLSSFLPASERECRASGRISAMPRVLIESQCVSGGRGLTIVRRANLMTRGNFLGRGISLIGRVPVYRGGRAIVIAALESGAWGGAVGS